MSTTREGYLRDLPHPSINESLKSNTHSTIKLLKTVGDFVSKVASAKEQLGNQLLSIVESFRKKNADMKRDRNALSSAVSCWETLLGEYEKQAQMFLFRENSENQIEKTDDLLQKQEHVQTLCLNTHNAYVLQLSTVNNMNRAFYSTTLPEMLDDLQLVQEDISESLRVAFSKCSKIEKDNASINRLDNVGRMFQLMNGRADISTFVQANNPGAFSPPRKSFSKPEDSQSLNVVDNKLYLGDVTEPVLKRKYIALQIKLRNYDTSIKKDQEAVKSLKQLQESYSDNPAYGNAVEVEDDLLKQKNELRVKEWYRCVSKEQTRLFTADVLNRIQVTEDDLQDEEISDDESVAGPVDKRQSVHSVKGKKIRKAGQHQFEDHTFRKPKFCYYCKSLIKGLV
ncbi:hypothetical protein P5673_007490 [Acropora cervicornis]|uniref:Uncharacterized protein n=1 Tax=Acropora cervicornis TaxID=6130 RepID=A0AAD9QW17_ACRCE|nr:hypothetical protein P5673_007490 [Acropora cervicornis]